MTQKWIIVYYEEGFLEPLKREFAAVLGRLKNPPSKTREIAKLLAEWNAIRQFQSEITALNASDDPLPHLRPAREENGQVVPEYYTLRVLSWTAYYHVSEVEKLCAGVFIHNDNHEAINVLATVLKDALERFQKRGGSEGGTRK
jgi:hypothetical protein